MERYLAIPTELRAPENELWISEWSDKNWRQVQTYQRWARSFNDASTKWYETKLDVWKLNGPLIATELDSNGRFVGVELLRSSGADELDAFALEVARTASSIESVPKALFEAGKRVRVLAVIGFVMPEKGGKVRPHASVNSLEGDRFHRRLSQAISDRFGRLHIPVQGEVTLMLGIKQGTITMVEAQPQTGNPKLNEFVVREVWKMVGSLPRGPNRDDFLLLPLGFR